MSAAAIQLPSADQLHRADPVLELTAAALADFRHELARGRVPDANGRVAAAGGEVLAVGVPREIGAAVEVARARVPSRSCRSRDRSATGLPLRPFDSPPRSTASCLPSGEYAAAPMCLPLNSFARDRSFVTSPLSRPTASPRRAGRESKMSGRRSVTHACFSSGDSATPYAQPFELPPLRHCAGRDVPHDDVPAVVAGDERLPVVGQVHPDDPFLVFGERLRRLQHADLRFERRRHLRAVGLAAQSCPRSCAAFSTIGSVASGSFAGMSQKRMVWS